MILVDDIVVRVYDEMPECLTEMVTPNSDGTYTILLNGKMSREKQTEAFWHAINHIESNDFEMIEEYGVQYIENQAHIRNEENHEKNHIHCNIIFNPDTDNHDG